MNVMHVNHNLIDEFIMVENILQMNSFGSSGSMVYDVIT